MADLGVVDLGAGIRGGPGLHRTPCSCASPASATVASPLSARRVSPPLEVRP
jgi:hypothetical protein